MVSIGSLARRIIRRAGYDLIRVEDQVPRIDYRTAVMSCLDRLGRVTIVIVGANDGKINDPLYPILVEEERLRKNSKILLIEPQSVLNPHIHEHYGFHPDYRLENCLVGSGSDLTLYSIKEEYWSRCTPDYAAGWPVYRAATGGSSTERDHLLSWAKVNLPELEDPAIAIQATQLPTKTLAEVLREHDMGPEVDVLQVDAEGADDHVIYACALERSQPRVMLYEQMNLGAERRAALAQFLLSRGYAELPSGGDSLAIRIA
jgi:hypothetical protein